MLLLSLLQLSTLAQGNTGSGDFTIGDSTLNERYDWVITINVKIQKEYLNYKTSTLTPMTKLSVAYRETPRLKQNQNRNTDVHEFEELWYHDCSAIGCRRYCELGLTPGEQGIIRVIPSDDASRSSCAISNAITRLLLDVGLMRCSLTAVFVPLDAIDAVIADLAKFNFQYLTPSPEKAVQSSMMLFVSSDPPKVKRSLYYIGP